MIELTYIFHSGFALVADECVIVFDYWMDPSGVVKRTLEENAGKPVYVFASHFHEDHFNREIFLWKSEWPNTHFTYILSKDILKHRRAQRTDADVWMGKGATWEDSLLKVTATGSNDSGVSWIVEVEGHRIFHAGDLCNWYARFLADGSADGPCYSTEFGINIDPVAEEKRFLGELKDVKKVADGFDLVMFPVDGRIGNGYTRGARQFISRFRVGMFVPMHFVMSGFESAWRMEPFCQEKEIPFWCIKHEGESISIISNASHPLTPHHQTKQKEEDVSTSLCIIRHTMQTDLPRLLEIFAHARQFMAQAGNPNQWDESYPSPALLSQDIASGDSYVLLHAGRIEATFLLRGGSDPTYSTIYQGTWLNSKPYATIHRIASTGAVKGVFHLVMQLALRHYRNIRIDTHHDNYPMQAAILREGFKYCGIIYCENGGERMAFQYDGEK